MISVYRPVTHDILDCGQMEVQRGKIVFLQQTIISTSWLRKPWRITVSSLATPGRLPTWAGRDNSLGFTLRNLAFTLALVSACLCFFAGIESRLMGNPNLLFVFPRAVTTATSGDVPVAKITASSKKKPSHWAKVRFSCFYVSTAPPKASTGRHKLANNKKLPKWFVGGFYSKNSHRRLSMSRARIMMRRMHSDD